MIIATLKQFIKSYVSFRGHNDQWHCMVKTAQYLNDAPVPTEDRMLKVICPHCGETTDYGHLEEGNVE